MNSKTLTRDIIPRIQKIGDETGCRVINLHAALENRPECFLDGVHPNKEGATVIAETIHAALAESRAD